MTAFPNVYHLRKVAETSAKSCDICYKPTNSVLFNPENKDFFYLCAVHLKDRGFARPIIEQAELAAKKRKEEMDREIEKVKLEYEDKRKKREEKEHKIKDDKKKGSQRAEEDEEEERKAERERTEKVNAITNQNATPVAEEMPRIYALQKYAGTDAVSLKLLSLIEHRIFYQKRVDRVRNAEVAKRNAERLRNPTTFPSVPSGGFG